MENKGDLYQDKYMEERQRLTGSCITWCERRVAKEGGRKKERKKEASADH